MLFVVAVGTASPVTGVHPYEHTSQHDPKPVVGKELDHFVTPIKSTASDPGNAVVWVLVSFIASIRLLVDWNVKGWRWAEVPWVIRAGKGLAQTVTEAVFEFTRPPRPLFAATHQRPGPNRLRSRTRPGNTRTPQCNPPVRLS